MNENKSRKITAHGAAQIIYGKTNPSDEQLASVTKMLVYGVLSGEQSGAVKRTWHTTTGAVAELMARRSLKNVAPEHTAAAEIKASAEKAIAEAHFSHSGDDELRGAYGEAMSDYFLAIMFRRKFLARGVAFQRAVFYGQLAAVLLIFGTLSTAAWAAFKPEAAHRTAVRAWIEDATDNYKIQEWQTLRPNPAGEGQLVPVKYRYVLPNRRSIETQRTFVVIGDQVIRQFNEEDEDG